MKKNIELLINKCKKNFIFPVLLFIFSFSAIGCKTIQNNNGIVSKEAMTPRMITINSQNENIATQVIPAVVAISSYNGYTQNIGSGVAIASGGIILTNQHVIQEANSIKLYLADGTTTKANILWKDVGLDLALIKANINLPYLKIAEKGTYTLGEEVIAIGTPLDLNFKHSVTKGVISAVSRTIQVQGENNYSTLTNLLQHDASINPGNSGGPLLNKKGEVIGINTIKVEDAEGLGFAIVCDTIIPVINNILTTGTHSNGNLGIFGYDISLEEFESKSQGFKIIDIKNNSPLNEFEIKKGDIIISINGEKINDYLSLKKKLYTLKQNSEVVLEIISNGEIKTIKTKLY